MHTIERTIMTVVMVLVIVYGLVTLGMTEWNESHIRLEALSVYDSVKEVIGE